MDLLTKIKGLTYLGWGTLFRSLGYSFTRAAAERRHGLRRKPVTAPVGQVVEVTRTRRGATFRLDAAELEIAFLKPDLARLTWTPGVLPVPYAVAKVDWPDVDPAWSEDADAWTLSTPELGVTVRRDGSVRFVDGQGAVLREDLPPLRRGEGWVHRARLADGERCLGLGLRSAPLDLRGGTYRLWNLEAKGAYHAGKDPLYVSVPVWLGMHAAGSCLVFFENPFDGRVTFADPATTTFEGGALRAYVIPGPPVRALERYSELTGLPALPPRWALGYHQARWSYMNEAEVREVARGFAERALPLSAIHLDIHYMDEHRVFTVDKARFPDLAGLSRDLDAAGVKLVTILDPGVKVDPAWDVYREGHDGGFFMTMPDGSELTAQVWPGTTAFPDFTCPRTREWWGSKYQRLVDAGITGFWHDMNEPAAFSAWGDCTLPQVGRHKLEGRGGDHREGHNLYALLEARAAHEALLRMRPGQRPWILSRSGYAAQQRYAWNWTGDCESNWWSLQQTVRIALSLSLSGVPYTGSDIGGFGGLPTPELFARWFQTCSMLPFFRTHSAFFTPRREPWFWDDATFAIVAEHLRLRQRLLPYFYTLAREASVTGHPLVRPMFWPDVTDPALACVEDQFLLGDALLVSPVMDEGARSRDVVLPAGRWYSLWDERPYDGPGTVRLDAPLDRVPVLVRAGAVVPMDEGGRTVLHVWVPAAGEGGGALFDDAGDGFGPGRDDRFQVVRDGRAIEILRTSAGDYPVPDGGFTLRLHGATAREAFADGRATAVGSTGIDVGAFRRCHLELV